MSTYAELVFHVLAHVPLATPPSCFEPGYVEWCTERLGPAARRELGDDVAVLQRVLVADSVAVRVQLLALLFSSAEQASRASSLDLVNIREELLAGTLGDPARGSAPAAVSEFRLRVLDELQRSHAEVEVLRLGCELEWRHLAQIPPPNPSPELTLRLAELACVAPALADLSVREIRPLWRRGRVMPRYGAPRNSEIWVGSASPGHGPGASHVCWQACHEATVYELSRAWEAQAHSAQSTMQHAYPSALEQAALVLLEERVKRAAAQRPQRAQARAPELDFAPEVAEGSEVGAGSGVGDGSEWAAWRSHLALELPRGISALRRAAPEGDADARLLLGVVEELLGNA